VAKLENVEWAQWLSGPFKTGDFDLTIVLHVEPFDLGNYTNPEYYWGYNNPKFNALYEKINNAPRADERNKLLGEAQQMLANDAVSVPPVKSRPGLSPRVVSATTDVTISKPEIVAATYRQRTKSITGSVISRPCRACARHT
jgi:ABC-type transport system substrate-binding protein